MQPSGEILPSLLEALGAIPIITPTKKKGNRGKKGKWEGEMEEWREGEMEGEREEWREGGMERGRRDRGREGVKTASSIYLPKKIAS